MCWILLLFVYSLRFAICFEFVVHNKTDSTIELSRHGLFRNSIHKFSISNFHLLINEWEKTSPLLMLSVERSKSLDLPYPIFMDMSTEYICLVARKRKSLAMHPNRVVFQMDFQTKSLVTTVSWDVWTTIDFHSNKTRLAEGEISNRNKTELAIAMALSSDNNGSISYNLDFTLSLADSEADEGLYKFHLHNCDNVPLSLKVLSELIDFEMIPKYFFTTQFSLNSMMYNTYIYCIYMLYDAYYLIVRYLSVLKNYPYSSHYFMNRKSLPHNSLSFTIFQHRREILDTNLWWMTGWLTDLEIDVSVWLLCYVSGRMWPSELLRALSLLPAVINYLHFCGRTTTSALVKEYLYPVLLVLLLIHYLLFFYVGYQKMKRYDKGVILSYIKCSKIFLLWYLGAYSYYEYVVSFDLVLQLMVANDLPFHFAWIQFLIEDVLTIAYLILCVYAIKQMEHLMVSKKNNKQIFSSEKALHFTVAIIV